MNLRRASGLYAIEGFIVQGTYRDSWCKSAGPLVLRVFCPSR